MTIRRFNLAMGIDGVQMSEIAVESSSQAVVDLNEKIRVLHVDDDPGLLKITKECLEMQAPVHVETALSVEEAFKKLENEKFDVIVSDYQMPFKDGLEFLKELRQRNDSIPFIIFTGKGREEVAIKALNLGANQYLNKTGDTETVYVELAHSVTELTKIKKLEEKRKKTEDNLRDSEERLRAIFTSSPNPIDIFDLNGNVIEINNAAMKLHGFSKKEEIVGKSSFDYVTPRDRQHAMKMFKRVLTGTINEGPQRVSLLTVDGRELLTEVSGSLIRDAKGRPSYVAVGIVDLTECKKAEAALSESEAKYRELVDRLPEMVMEIDTKARVIFINKRGRDLLGYSEEDFKGGFDANRFVAPEDLERSRENMGKMFMGEMRYSNEYTFIKKDGTRFPVSLSSSPIVKDEKICGARGIIIDISERKKAENELKESEARFRSLYANSLDAVLLTKPDGTILSANSAACCIFGMTEEEIRKAGRGGVMVIDERLISALKERERLGKTRAELTFTRKNGSTFEGEMTSSIFTDTDGTAKTSMIIRDITERKNAEKRLVESELKYRGIFNNAEVAMFRSRLDGSEIVDCNEKFLNIFGLTLEEIVGKPSTILWADPLERQKLVNILKAEGQVKDFECRLLTKQSEIRMCLASMKLYPEEGILEGSIIDITELKRIEQDLRCFSSAVKASLDGVITGDMSGNIRDANEAALRIYGSRNKSELIGKNVQDLLVERDRARAQQNSMETIQFGQGKTAEYTILTKNQVEVPIEVTTQLLVDEKGNSTGFVDIVRDLTERKNKEEELIESREKYKDIFENARDAIYVYDLKGKIISINKVVQEYGYTQEQIIGKNMLKFIPKKYWPKSIAALSQLAQGKRVEGEIEVNTPSGKIHAEYRSNPIIRDNKVVCVHSILRDTTERKRAEENLFKSQLKFKALFEGNPEAVVHVGPDFHVIDINPAFEALFGYRLDEIKARNIDDIIVPIDKTDEAQMLDASAKQDKHVGRDTVRRRKDGSLVQVFVSAAPITVHGQFSGYVAVYKDISNLKKAEQNLAVMNEKLRVVGGLTRHDVRNKLSAITGNAYLLKRRLASDNDALEKLRDMEVAVEQTVSILDFAKMYEMLGVEKLTYVDVEKTINEAVSLFSGLDGVKLTNGCHGLSVQADSLLRQLFYNLVDNSLKYAKKLTQIKIHYEKAPNNQLKLFYEDDGIGIPTEVKGKLFNEGFTTGKGTGYGLYLIKKMTEVYGWTIQETGEPTKGVQFIITMPNINPNGKESYRIATRG